jgi:adenylylsulfate kinase
LSGAGKTTLSRLVQAGLVAQGIRCDVLDGDIVRTQFSKGLGFSREDRDENIRRTSNVAASLALQGRWVVTATISPYRATRNHVRQFVESSGLCFLEVYVRCPLEVAEQRDPKGLYKLARAGRIPSFTGISDPYEEPDGPDLIVDTAEHSPEFCASAILGL